MTDNVRATTNVAAPGKERSAWERFWSGRQPAAERKPRKNDIVSRRNRPMARLGRLVRRYWFLASILSFLLYAYYFDNTMLGLLFAGLTFIGRLAFAVLYMIIQFGAIFWFMSRSKVETIRPEDPKIITFDDYWGQPNLKALVRQWMSLLSDREAFVKMGGQYINGLLLYGEPGTGKTMLAKAMAGETGVAFISIEGSGFRAMFWGVDVLKMIWFVGKARKLAREYGACIAYIDEIDAVGMSRGGVMGRGGGMMGGMGGGMMGMGGGTGALTRLLYEMDGVGEQTRSEKWMARWYRLLGKKPPPRNWHVLFMGSTNRPDVLDPALTRPGRFDQTIQVDLPDKSGRREIIQGYLNRIKHDNSVDVEALVADTARSTPAQIMAAITKDAVRIALFDGRSYVTQLDIEKGFLQQRTGIENPIEEMDPEQRREVAVHEAAHAVVQHYLVPEQRIVHVTIVARAGGIMGFMMHLDEIEQHAYPLRKVVAGIMVSMAGHVGVRLVFGEHWIGAGSDFRNVRNALNELYAYGYFGPPVGDVGFGDKEAKGEDMLKRFWLRLEGQVEQLLQEHYNELIAISDALLEKQSLTTNEVLALLGPNSKQLKEREKAAALAGANGRELIETPALPEPEAQHGENGREEEPEPEPVAGD